MAPVWKRTPSARSCRDPPSLIRNVWLLCVWPSHWLLAISPPPFLKKDPGLLWNALKIYNGRPPLRLATSLKAVPKLAASHSSAAPLWSFYPDYCSKSFECDCCNVLKECASRIWKWSTIMHNNNKSISLIILAYRPRLRQTKATVITKRKCGRDRLFPYFMASKPPDQRLLDVLLLLLLLLLVLGVGGTISITHVQFFGVC